MISKSFLKYIQDFSGPVAIGAIGLLYFSCLPSTVQDLDSGELVAKAYNLQVAHPPGYPLFLWIYFAFTHLFAVGSIFWRASFLTSILSLLTLFLLWRSLQLQGRHWCNILWAIPLALSELYWRYSVIPDVFMLHVFLMALILYLYLALPHSPRRAFFLAILGALGLAHHHSIIFIFPLILHAHWGLGWRLLARHVVLGLVIVLTFYLSILLLHPHSLYSWGCVDNLGQLWSHFTRADYGTFNLSGREGSGHFTAVILLWGKTILRDCPLVLIYLAVSLLFVIRHRKIRASHGVIFLCLFLYLVLFFGKSNINPQGLGGKIVERFYLTPTLLVYFFLVLIRQSWPQLLATGKLRFLWPLGAILGLWVMINQTIRIYPENNYSKNTIIEDYAYNLMAPMGQEKPTVILVDTDTKYFAIRYLQSVGHFREDLILYSMGRIFEQHETKKIRRLFPQLIVPENLPKRNEGVALEQNLLEPNIRHFNFMFTRNVNLDQYKTTYYPLGRLVSQGQGIAFAPSSIPLQLRHHPRHLSLTPRYSESRDLFAEYSFYHLAQGIHAPSDQLSIPHFQRAIQLVPYCLPALYNLCYLQQERSVAARICNQITQGLRQKSWDYYP